MASAPPDQPPTGNRALQFSLKTVLALMTLYCLWLAAAAFEARQQKQAIQRIAELRGQIAFSFELDDQGNWEDNPQPLVPQWIRRAIGEDYFRRVAIVNFDEGSDPSNDDLRILGSFDSLQQLTLSNRNRITDDGLTHLAGLRELNILMLDGTHVTGPGLRHLRGLPRLEGLSLSSTSLEDSNLESLAELTNLKWLHLNDTNVSDAGLRHLASFESLEELQLVNTEITDAGLQHLASLSRLKRILLRGTQTTSGGRTALQKALPHCKVPQ